MHAWAAELRPLPALRWAAGAGLGLAAVAVAVADLPWQVQVTLFTVLAGAIGATARSLRRADRGRRLAWGADGRWWLDGREVAVEPSSCVYAGLAVLVLRETPGGRRQVLRVLRQGVDASAFRQLKARVRLGALAPRGGAGSAP